MDGSDLEGKSFFKMLGLTFSSNLNWGCYIISSTKAASKKIGALIRSMKFLSTGVALYLCKSTIVPFMEYCCYVAAGAPGAPRLCNSLPIECFLLTYNRNGLMSRISRHLLTVCSF